MERKSHFGVNETLGLDSLALWQQWWRWYENYDKNQIWRLKYDIYEISGINRSSKRSIMDFGKLNGIQLEFGDGGRLGKGGHMENHERTP